MRYFLLSCFVFLQTLVYSQGITGQVDDPEFGFTFEVPQGWEAVKSGTSYLIASNTQKGIILVSAGHLTTLADLRADLKAPVSANNIELKPVGAVEEIDELGLGTLFEGIMQGIATKGYAINFLAGENKSGTIFAAVEKPSYSEAYRNLAIQLYQSTQNSSLTPETQSSQPAIASGDLGNAADFVKGRQLAAISTAGGYGSSGYRKKEIIHFCSSGRFIMYTDESMVINTPGGGGATDASQGAVRGQWKFDKKNGQYFLTLVVEGNSGQMPVRIYQDKYGDRRFEINKGHYGYYGQAECE